MEMNSSLHVPAAWPPIKNPLYPPELIWMFLEENYLLPALGFEPHTIQPMACWCTDYSTPACKEVVYKDNLLHRSFVVFPSQKLASNVFVVLLWHESYKM
jgi:hypothetical protein